MAEKYTIIKRLGWTADGHLVDVNSPLSAFVAYSPGQQIPMADAIRFGLVEPEPEKKEPESEPEPKQDEQPENKMVEAPENKGVTVAPEARRAPRAASRRRTAKK
jgi:hypothetical protein